MVQPNNASGGGLAPWQMNPNEAQQTLDMQQLVNEFPQVDQLVLVEIYYNEANQNLSMARQLLTQQYSNNFFGQSVFSQMPTPTPIPTTASMAQQQPYGGSSQAPHGSQSFGQPIMGVGTTAQNPYQGVQNAYQPVMGIPSTSQTPQNPTYADGMMDPQSAQMHANGLVFGEPPAQADQNRRQSVIPSLMNNKAPIIDESDALYRETLLYMRIQLRSDMLFSETVKVMNTVIQNILKNPNEDKFCKLRLSNASIRKNIGDIDQARFLLEMIGFEQMKLIPDPKPGQPRTGAPEDYLVLVRERADPRDMNHFCSILQDITAKNNLTPLTSKIVLTPSQKSQLEETKQKSQIPINYKKQAQMKALAKGSQGAKDRLREAAAQRIDRQINHPELYEQQRNFTYVTSAFDGEIEAYREHLNVYNKSQTQKKRTGPRHMTLEDTQKIIDQKTRERNNAQAAGNGQSEQWGIRALDLTNQFRQGHSLPSLSWNQPLHDIAMEHCIAMADGVVPVGHDGFDARSSKVPFYKRSFGENVAYNYGQTDSVQCAVTGWINSPGHRANMLATNTLCGIAVYCKYGHFYFTQLFALA